MFREPRRKDRAISDEECYEILNEQTYGVLCTYGEDGYPYGAPVNYAYIDNKIYFHGKLGFSHRNDNMKFCPNVCFTVVGNSTVLPEKFSCDFSSVIIFGKARELLGEEKKTVFLKMMEKIVPQYMDIARVKVENGSETTGVYAIDIEHMTGKKRK